MPLRQRATFVVTSLATVLMCHRVCAVIPEFSIVDLGTLGGNESEAYSVSDSGRVVGWSRLADDTSRAFATAPNAPINPSSDALPLPSGATEHFAYGINSSGVVAGVASTSSGDRAFRFSGGASSNLGTLGGDWSYAYAVNNAGQIAGGAAKPAVLFTYPTHAFMYDGSMHDLGTLGGIESYAHAISSSGQIVGYSQLQPTPVGYTPAHAFIWKPTAPNGTTGQMSDLGTLGGTTSYAFGINDAGAVVGGSNTLGDLDYHAFLRTVDGQMIDLGTLGGATSEARSINSLGMIVGDADSPAGSRAFFYADGTMRDLNALIPANSNWFLKQARAINSLGQIVGTGSNPSGASHGYLLTPLPTWKVDSSGSWGDGANWLGGVPPGTDADVRFTNAITAPRAVTLDGSRTVGRIVFDNTSAYSLAGPGTLTVNGSAAGETGLCVRSGSHTISSAVRFVGTGATVSLAPGAGLNLVGGVEGTVSQLDILAAATLDFARGNLIVDYASGNPSPLPGIRSSIASGYANGSWTGAGIRSSFAASDPSRQYAIGYAEGSQLSLATFGGYPVDGSAVVMGVTLSGDADLNGAVNSFDFNRFVGSYGIGAALWAQGDFDYSGTVDSFDFNMLAGNFGQTLPANVTLVASGSVVPEPDGLLVVSILLWALGLRLRPTLRLVIVTLGI